MARDQPRPLRRDLTPQSFHQLLARLSSDPQAAADQYVRLRARLVDLFRWRQLPTMAEALADEVLTRVARRIDEGHEIVSLPAYVLGVARLVALEAYDRNVREKEAHQRFVEHVAEGPDQSVEAALVCLDACLATLAPDRRTHLLAYYTGDGATRIARRQALAEELGIDAVALRNRMLRMRQSLEACVLACLSRRTAAERERDGSASGSTGDRARESRRSGRQV